jgi:trans-aconitate 2-methyltransferase
MNIQSRKSGSLENTTWDPDLYAAFGDQRMRPAIDLIQRIPSRTVGCIYDLGCGDGKVTRLLASRWPTATLCGVDHSTEMLSKASASTISAQWRNADIRDWQPAEPADLIFSNAALQWVGRHDVLFPRLVSYLGTGGCMALQMPQSYSLKSHELMRSTLRDIWKETGSRKAETLYEELNHRPVGSPDYYYDLLAKHVDSIDIWESEYLQVLEGDEPVLQWVGATSLRPILRGLDPVERDSFLHAYKARLLTAYPGRRDGSTLYPFRRLFIVAMA